MYLLCEFMVKSLMVLYSPELYKADTAASAMDYVSWVVIKMCSPLWA